MADPKNLESHFAFGENWQSFVATIDHDKIAKAVDSLARLLPASEVMGRSFLDIGCGSGLSMLAAAHLGARSLEGVDIDPRSVDATRTLLSQRLPGASWGARVASVFSLTPERDGQFDIVHSWGVLHHTGDMWSAIGRAANLVAPGGRLVLALYRKTPLCGFWRIEKRLYTASPSAVQTAVRWIYQGIYCAGLLATGRNPARYVREYKTARGMDWRHDVHDWLGGYPYESVEPNEVAARLTELGFAMVCAFEKPAALGGLFGSHCDEFVAVRRG